MSKNGKRKAAKVKRVKMTDEQVTAYLKKYAKERDLDKAELQRAIEHCAAKRWSALERWAKDHA